MVVGYPCTSSAILAKNGHKTVQAVPGRKKQEPLSFRRAAPEADSTLPAGISHIARFRATGGSCTIHGVRLGIALRHIRRNGTLVFTYDDGAMVVTCEKGLEA